MNEATIRDAAREILGATLGIDPMEMPDSFSTADAARWDSLYHFTLIASLEDGFGVTYTSEEIPAMTSLSAITLITAQRLESGR